MRTRIPHKGSEGHCTTHLALFMVTAPPPLYNGQGRPGLLVPPAGVEPTLANYLLHTGYKSAVLPLNYRGIFWLPRVGSNHRHLD